MPTIEAINRLDRAPFVALLGHVFEAAPWVAERAWDARPFADTAALHRAMTDAVASAGADARLALVRGHPDLAGKAARAGRLGAESTAEQAGAGLDRLSEAEFARFHELNDAYRRRFGFPFVIAVRGHDAAAILAAFERRLGQPAGVELSEALEQVARIARFRLADLLAEPADAGG